MPNISTRRFEIQLNSSHLYTPRELTPEETVTKMREMIANAFENVDYVYDTLGEMVNFMTSLGVIDVVLEYHGVNALFHAILIDHSFSFKFRMKAQARLQFFLDTLPPQLADGVSQSWEMIDYIEILGMIDGAIYVRSKMTSINHFTSLRIWYNENGFGFVHFTHPFEVPSFVSSYYNGHYRNGNGEVGGFAHSLIIFESYPNLTITLYNTWFALGGDGTPVSIERHIISEDFEDRIEFDMNDDMSNVLMSEKNYIITNWNTTANELGKNNPPIVWSL